MCIFMCAMFIFQSKFKDSIKHEVASWNPPHGIRLECTCTVVLNALGYIGFKVNVFLFLFIHKQQTKSFILIYQIIYIFIFVQVISTSGDKTEYLWTLERNLDVDTHFQAKLEASYNN